MARCEGGHDGAGNRVVGSRQPGGAGLGLLRPTGAGEGAGAGLLVIQEVWGVDGHIHDVAARFATAGYAALAPDLYSAAGGRPPALSAERVEQAKAFLNTMAPPEWTGVLAH